MIAKSNGFDDLSKKLGDIAKNAEALSGEHSIPMSELFHPDFMKKNSKFDSFDDFSNSSPFDFSELENIDENELDQYISSNTSFSSWQDMKSTAAKEWVTKRL